MKMTYAWQVKRSALIGALLQEYAKVAATVSLRGAYQKAKETAKILSDMQLSLEAIAKATGLSEAEIKKL